MSGSCRRARTCGSGPPIFHPTAFGRICRGPYACSVAPKIFRLVKRKSFSPRLSRRHITLLNPDGRPKANLDLTVSIYLWDQNHCGFHEGLPLGEFRTDAKGTIEVLAPLVPLYLDGLQYFEQAGDGPAGLAYAGNIGMKIAADEAVVIQVAWELPEITVQLQVLTGSGRPRPHVDVYGNWKTNTCGGHDRMADTDARGIVRLNLDATFTALTLMIGGPYSPGDPEGDENTRGLSDAELRRFFQGTN